MELRGQVRSQMDGVWERGKNNMGFFLSPEEGIFARKATATRPN
jgi:hypothetical protein